MPMISEFMGPLDLSNPFKLANLGVGVLFILGGISQFFPISFQSTVIAVYVIIFGLGLVLLELRAPPPLTYSYASFLFSFVGRGIFYIFIGTLLLHDHILRIIAGSVIALVGVGYVAVEFVPSLAANKPQSMVAEGGYPDYENATDTI